jgi:hypothetical protein
MALTQKATGGDRFPQKTTLPGVGINILFFSLRAIPPIRFQEGFSYAISKVQTSNIVSKKG